VTGCLQEGGWFGKAEWLAPQLIGTDQADIHK
jgi:hypothetical protein